MKTRRYYIESEYVNGVYDSDGRQLIRPLTSKEKEWLNKFYAETVCASFNKDNEQNLYKTDEAKKELYGENNARNRCLFNHKQTVGKLVSLDIEDYDEMIERHLGHVDPDLFLLSEKLREEEELEDFE